MATDWTSLISAAVGRPVVMPPQSQRVEVGPNVVDELRRRGFTVRVEADRLLVGHPDNLPLPPPLATALKSRRDEVLAALRPTAEDHENLVAVFDLVGAARKLASWCFLDHLEELARGYHRFGQHDLLRQAVATARNVHDNAVRVNRGEAPQ